MKPTIEYALYKGENLLHMGTITELIEKTKLKRATLLYYQTPSYQKRGARNGKILIKLTEDDEE